MTRYLYFVILLGLLQTLISECTEFSPPRYGYIAVPVWLRKKCENYAFICSGHSHRHRILPTYTNMSDIEKNSKHVNLAVLQIVNSVENENITLWFQSCECCKCDLIEGIVIEPGKSLYTFMDTRWATRLKVTNGHRQIICKEKSYSFYEFGNYKIWTTVNGSGSFCIGPILMNDPPNKYSPLFVAMAVLATLVIIWAVVKRLMDRHMFHYLMPNCCRTPESYVSPDLGLPPAVNEADSTHQQLLANSSYGKKERLRSLDCFRGFSLVVMIFVNYGGGGYWFFKHSTWNGLTIADLVFPWFVFIMGTSMTLSFASRLRHAVTKFWMIFKIFKRSFILFGIGILLNTYGRGMSTSNLRILGVLQRLALTYLIVALVHLIFVKTHDVQQYSVWSLQDVRRYWLEWLIHLSFLIVYLSLTFALPVPGCPTGYIGPGGLADGGEYANCSGGAAGYIDRTVLGDSHIYQKPTFKNIYKTDQPYDPEGILGTLTSCFICFLGLQAGKILLIYKNSVARTVRWFCWGIVTCVIATILCKATQNDGWIPINKNLWSVSFVLLLSGFAFFLLTFFYLLIDVYKVWSGAPFIYPGMNPIVIYVLHEVFHYLFEAQFLGYEPLHWQLLFMDLFGTSVWVIVAYIMYRKHIFISI